MKNPSLKLVILDRDGVVNHDSDKYIKNVDEWQPIPGSLEAIAKLSHAGYKVVICTNQSGIGRGLYDVDTLNAMHDKMYKLLSKHGGHVDAIFFCPHTELDECTCRKPNNGMLKEIMNRFDLGDSLSGIPVVGDSLRDLSAGVSLGANPHLVLTGKGEKTRAAGGLPPYTAIHADLASFVNHLLASSS